MEFVTISFELIIGYFALLILTKILGKTQLSQITAFDFISALVLGELVGNALFDDNIGITKILFSMVFWGILVFSTEIVTQKFMKARPFLEGGPSLVINKGEIDYDELKKNHLDLNQLQHLLRMQGIFSVKECLYAILETDGMISVMKKPEYEFVTKKDLSIQTHPPSLSYSVILDGEIVEGNLKEIGWDKHKLIAELNSNGVHSVKDVLFAEWNENQPLYIQLHKKEKNA